MATEPARFRPKQFPPPEFPPKPAARFSRTPPAVFPVILGALGLVLALRRGLVLLEVDAAPADLLAGLVLALWAFAVFAYAAKLVRRFGAFWDDLKVLPGRAGVAAATVGGLAAAAVLVPYAPEVARGLLFASLAMHGLLALAVVRVLLALPPEGRGVNPGWHLTFVGFIVGALAAVPLGHAAMAQGLLVATMPVAGVIWGISAVQLTRRVPPAPLRPMLAIHLAPASLFSIVAGLTGQAALSVAFAVLGLVIAAALLVAGRWIAEAGFSALWGAFTFPLAALASALLGQAGIFEGVFVWAGIAVLAAALGVVPYLLWRVLKLWPGGQLAAKTNAAQA